MTIKKLSEISGISLNTLYSITKRDSKKVDAVLLQRIADTLRVNVLDLLPPAPSNEIGYVYDYIDQLDSEGRKAAYEIMEKLMELTPEGQQKAIERVSELTEVPKYQRKEEQA